jgi:hypothetical protein
MLLEEGDKSFMWKSPVTKQTVPEGVTKKCGYRRIPSRILTLT